MGGQQAALADRLGPEERGDFFVEALSILTLCEVPFMVGGAYAFDRYTGIARKTKDLDVFTFERHVRRALAAFGAAGYETELTDTLWIAKAFQEDYFVDIIFNSGNGLCPVDESWLEHASDDLVVGVPVKLCPAEEIIWTKTFIMERERYDGADIAHLIRARGRQLDWRRILARMAGHAEVLLAHLLLYRYIYPAEADAVPEWVIGQLVEEAGLRPLGAEMDQLCQGTLLSRYQYTIDVEQWGYRDARPRLPQPLAA